MQELFFFRDVKDYNELLKKTILAHARNSKNKQRVSIIKVIELQKKEFDEIARNLKKNNRIFVENNKEMIIEGGVWKCICLKHSYKEIIVMTDGYQYPKFVALNEKKIDKEVVKM